MSIKICACSAPFGNTGTSSVSTPSPVDKLLILVPEVANDGTINEIDLTSDVLNLAFFDAKFNHVDKSKRWYPVPEIENIEDVRGDPTLQTLNSGVNLIAQVGTRTFASQLIKREPEYLKELEKFACARFGAYVITVCGDLKGSTKVVDKLRPIAINENNWNPNLVKATDSTVQAIALNFEWKRGEKDSDIAQVNNGDITGISLEDVEGLLDIIGDESLPIPLVTEISFDLFLKYGSKTNPIKVEGILLAEVSLLNETTELAVAPIAVTEISAGRYTVTFIAQTSADVIVPSVTKTGFDGSATGISIALP